MRLEKKRKKTSNVIDARKSTTNLDADTYHSRCLHHCTCCSCCGAELNIVPPQLMTEVSGGVSHLSSFLSVTVAHE